MGVCGAGVEVHDLYGVWRRGVRTARTARTVFLHHFGWPQRMAWTELIGAFSIDAHGLARVYWCPWGGGEVCDLYGIQRRHVRTARTARTVFLLQFDWFQRMRRAELIGAFPIDAQCHARVYWCPWGGG